MDRRTLLLFGMQLRKLRKEKKLSQDRLGRAVGVHYNSIGKYEMGAAFPSVPVLMKLSEVLEVSMDDLTRGHVHGQDTAPAVEPSPASAVELSQPPPADAFDADDRLEGLVERVKTLPPEDRRIVIAVLEAFLSRRAVADLMRLGAS